MDTCMWMRLLPMDIQEVTERQPPQQPIGSDDTVIGTLPDELINLYSLWTATSKESSKTLVDLHYAVNDEALQSLYDELSDKAKALESLFWIAVKEHFHLWGIGLTDVLGVRQEYKVVKSKRPPVMFNLFKGFPGV